MNTDKFQVALYQSLAIYVYIFILVIYDSAVN